MAKRKLTPTQKLRNNVKRQIRNMENRGYRIDDLTKEKLKTAPYQTLKSYQRNKYGKLYAEATALSEEGDIVSGTEYRKQERKASALKGARTRQSHVTSSESEWEQQRREQDRRDRENASKIEEGQLIYNRVLDMISHFPSNGALRLQQMLTSEIKNYGADNVMRSFANAPEDVISNAETVIYTISRGTGKEVIHNALLSIIDIIRGTKTTDEEAKDIGDMMDEMTDAEST